MQLEEYIINNSLNAASFGRLIGVKSRATVGRYLKGRVPDKHIINKIAAITNGKVTANDFYENVKPNGKHKSPRNKKMVNKN